MLVFNALLLTAVNEAWCLGPCTERKETLQQHRVLAISAAFPPSTPL